MSKPSQLPFVDFLGNGLVDMKFSSDVNIPHSVTQFNSSNGPKTSHFKHFKFVFVYDSYGVQDSEPYVAIGKIRAL